MSEQSRKKPGFFGRLFGNQEAEPSEQTPAPEEAAPREEAPELEPTPLEPDPAKDLSEPPAEAPAETAPVPDEPPETAEPDTQAVPEPSPEPAEEAAGTERMQEPAAEPRESWFRKLTSGLSRSSGQLGEKLTGIFTKRRLDDETLQDLEDVLIQADLGVETAMRITEALAEGRYDKEISAEEVRSVMAEEVTKVLAPVTRPLEVDSGHRPHVILVVGVNGSGKTTTIGKLAAKFRDAGRSVVLGAGDTFRAAAVEQLKIWGQRTGAEVVARAQGADASGLAYDALARARETGADVLILDTAGRLQNKADLMAELEKIVRVLKKQDETAPHDVVLVLDATTGQNAMSQVEIFQRVCGVTGLVMTKLDGTARGGILVAIAARHKLPVHAIGVGEGVDDLQPFDAGEFARAIAGLPEVR